MGRRGATREKTPQLAAHRAPLFPFFHLSTTTSTGGTVIGSVGGGAASETAGVAGSSAGHTARASESAIFDGGVDMGVGWGGWKEAGRAGKGGGVAGRVTERIKEKRVVAEKTSIDDAGRFCEKGEGAAIRAPGLFTVECLGSEVVCW